MVSYTTEHLEERSRRKWNTLPNTFAMEITINDSKDLRKITSLVHDSWFDIDQVLQDHKNGIVKIYFQKSSKLPADKKNRFASITIKNVQRLEVKDTEKIGYYDFNEIKYLEKERCLVITTGVPIGIKIFISFLEIVLENNQ